MHRLHFSHRTLIGRNRIALAFTLTELLVCIAIITILIAVTTIAVISSRRSANRLQCASALRQIGVAFSHYAGDFNGYWPIGHYGYADGGGLNKYQRWYDHIAPYVNGGVKMNADGTNRVLTDPRSPEVIIQDVITSPRSKRTVLWGCPDIDLNAVSFCCYGMNQLPFAPYSGNAYTGVGFAPYAFRDENSSSLASRNGWYFKASQWRKPSERALIGDSSTYVLSIDEYSLWEVFNRSKPLTLRHKRDRAQVDSPGINVLFCDGSVSTLSVLQLTQAVYGVPIEQQR